MAVSTTTHEWLGKCLYSCSHSRAHRLVHESHLASRGIRLSPCRQALESEMFFRLLCEIDFGSADIRPVASNGGYVVP